MNNLIRGIQVNKFEELVACNALYRPGPMGIGAHEEYINNKFNPEKISLVHPALESILAETNGVLVFQEQLMFIADKIGGMGLGKGDMLRRYMDKASKIIARNSAGETLTDSEKNNKNWKGFQEYWNMFLDGATAQGYKKDEVDKIKDWVIQYLGYSFNKCLTKNHEVLSEERGKINMLDVKIGEKVLGYNPDTNKDEYNPVKDIHHNGKKKVYRIKTKSGKVLECTEDHKIMTDGGMKTLKEIRDNKLKIKIR
jgi:DNA polymerase-3 subunit alpha